MAAELKQLICPDSKMCLDLYSINVQSQAGYLKAIAELCEDRAIVTENTVTSCYQEQNTTESVGRLSSNDC